MRRGCSPTSTSGSKAPIAMAVNRDQCVGGVVGVISSWRGEPGFSKVDTAAPLYRPTACLIDTAAASLQPRPPTTRWVDTTDYSPDV